MILKEEKKFKLERERITSAMCDKCEIVLNEEDYPYGDLPICHIKYTGGYNSDYPGDLDTLEVDLCEKCMEDLFLEFATITHYPSTTSGPVNA